MTLTAGAQTTSLAAGAIGVDLDVDLDASWLLPNDPVACVILAHGAGADHRHASMQSIAEALAAEGIATFRFNFPFMQRGQRRVDSQAVSVACIVAAVNHVRAAVDVPLFLGGHSFGGRMASHAVLDTDLPVQGLIFCSFPLHSAKKPARKRAAHLPQVRLPMLFLSGTRDDLADQALLTEVTAELSQATLHWLDTANHSYQILKRQRAPEPSVFAELAQRARIFIDQHCP